MSDDTTDRAHWLRHEILKAIQHFGGSAISTMPDDTLIERMRETMGYRTASVDTDAGLALAALRATLRAMLSDYGLEVSNEITNEGLIKKLAEALDGTPDGTKIVLRGDILGALAEGGVDVPGGATDGTIVEGVRRLATEITSLKKTICKASKGQDTVDMGDPLYRFCNTVSFLGYGKARSGQEEVKMPDGALERLAIILNEAIETPRFGIRNTRCWRTLLKTAIAEVVSETVGAAIEKSLEDLKS